MPAIDFLTSYNGGHPVKLFDLIPAPAFLPKDPGRSKLLGAWHLAGQWAVYALILPHLGAVTLHLVWRKSGLLGRMPPAHAAEPETAVSLSAVSSQSRSTSAERGIAADRDRMIRGTSMTCFKAAALAAGAWLAGACGLALADEAPASGAQASEPADQQTWAIHGQATFVLQAHDAFHSPYRGPNSLAPEANGRETFDVTLYAGVRPWSGAEVWINPEIDQGFGLSNTLGVAGFPSGEAYKVGRRDPYVMLHRLFLRQTIDLGGETQKLDPDLNQLGGSQTADRLVLTVGKFSVVDVFDTNQYAHDPRHDFLNWALVDAGTFDYAANAWGYTYGAAAEVYRGRWAVRAGVFDLSDSPNSARLDPTFSQFQLVAELEERHEIEGQPGKLKLTAFDTRGRMGNFDDAIRLAQATGQPADIAAVRRYRSRRGVSFNLEQQLTASVGAFVKGGVAGGDTEPYEFADIDRSLAAGASVKGDLWRRPDDTWAVAGVVNGVSRVHETFLDFGGTGILVGDGQLPHPSAEQILETYYDLAVAKPLHLSLDYQFVNHPAYNRDRGPVSIGALRLHAQF